VKGEGNQVDFGLRVYDPRVGKFLSVDPMGRARASWTPYNAMRNNPISNIDPTGGLDEWVQTKDGQTLWDDKVIDQKSATQRYGDGATYRGAGYSYTSKSGEKVTLGSNRSFTVNGASKTAVNSTNPYDPGTFTYWNYANGRNYDNQVEAYRAWQSYSGYHPGEGKWDRILRGAAYGSMEARRDYASGGMNMNGGAAHVAREAAAVESFGANLQQLTKAEMMMIRGGGPLPLKPANASDIVSGCEKVAKSVQKVMGGEFLQITPKFGRYLGPVKYAGMEGPSWGHHVAVIKEGVVYDMMTGAEGLPLNTYKQIFEYADDLNFNIVSKMTLK
jgi:hypothetical protein